MTKLLSINKGSFKYVIFFLIASLQSEVWIDNPINSIIFYRNYHDSRIILELGDNGQLNQEGCDYLSSNLISIEYKLALINCLSIKNYSKRNSNFKIYLDYLEDKYKKKYFSDNLVGNDVERLCLEFLRAYDYTQDISISKKNIDNISGDIEQLLSFNIVKFIIYSTILDSDKKNWPKIHKTFFKIIDHNDLIKDIKQNTIRDISDFFDSYTGYRNDLISPTGSFIPYDKAPKQKSGKSISDFMVYPEIARQSGIEGKVYIKFFVDNMGIVQEDSIQMLPLSPGNEQSVIFKEAAISAVSQSEWEPAMQRYSRIGVWMTVPINFKLENNWKFFKKKKKSKKNQK